MKKLLLAVFPILLLSPTAIQAQMFSVGDSNDRPASTLSYYSTLGVTWEIADFEYTGDALSADDRADFQNSVIRLRFENPGINISAGFGGTLTGMDDRSYVNVNAQLYNDIALIRSPRFVLGLPIQISTDLLSVAAQQQTGNSFQQSSLVFGTGASIRYRINQRVQMGLRATPNIGFSFSQGALFGGRLFTTTSGARLYFSDILGSNTLVFGYDFDYRDYNIEGDQNDYQYLSHAFTLGIAF